MDERDVEEETKDLKGVFHQLLSRGILLWVVYLVLIALVIVGCWNYPIWMAVVLAVAILVLLLTTAALVMSYVYLKKDFEATKKGDFKTCLRLATKMRKLSFGRPREIYYGDEARAYLLLDDLPHAKESFAHVHNLLYLDAFAYLRVYLLLEEGKVEEAKAAHLSYALHHRNGKSFSERNVVLIGDGIFHHLEGTPLSKEEEKAVASSEFACVKRFMTQEVKSPANPVSNQAVLMASASDQALLEKSRQRVEEEAGSGQHRFGPYLTTLFIASLVLPIILFLLAIVLGSERAKDDPTLEVSSMMWIMAFAALLPLSSLVLAYLARKKEPQDHYVKNLVIGYIQFPLCVLLALLSMASTSNRDYSYLSYVSEVTSLSFPKEGHLKRFELSGGTTPDLKGETLVVFDEGESYSSFVEGFTSSGTFWVSWDKDYEKIAISNAYYSGDGYYAYDYVSFYNATDQNRNTIPTATGEYHFWEIAHVKSKTWVWIYEYLLAVR